jgi:ribosome-binding ATPase YchF (GTP1/OBG family)
VALEVGIVGLPSSGKTTLFRALTRAETHGSGKEHVGMAQIPDERLGGVAETVGARKVTPAAVRVVDVPGTGPQLLGNLRQVDALLVVLDGFSGTRVPADDLETLKLELLVADRDHVERRLERVGKQAKSGDARLKAEAADLERLLAHLDAGRTLAEWEGELPPELEPLTTKPLLELVNGGPGAAGGGAVFGREAAALPPSLAATGIDLQLEAELSELSPEEAAEFRGGGESALGEVVRRLAETLDLITFFTAGEKETRAWTLTRGETALDAAETIHSDIARGFIRCEVVRWDDLVEAGGHAEAPRAGKQRLEGKPYVVEDGDVLNIRFNV